MSQGREETLDNFEPDPLAFLGLKEKELLKILSDLDGLSEEEEIRSLIHVRARVLRRALGLLGEPPKRAATEVPKETEYLKVSRVRVETAPPGHKGSDPGHQNKAQE